MSERGVAQVVSERDGLGQVFIQTQGASHRPGDLRDFEGVRQPGAVVVALRAKERPGSCV